MNGATGAEIGMTGAEIVALVSVLAMPVAMLLTAWLTVRFTGKRERERLNREDERSREEREDEKDARNRETRRMVYGQFLRGANETVFGLAGGSNVEEVYMDFIAGVDQIKFMGGEEVVEQAKAIELRVRTIQAQTDHDLRARAARGLGGQFNEFTQAVRDELQMAPRR